VPPIDESYRLALPNKFFDYLMAGLAPVIGPSPEMADVCRQWDCGVVAPDFSVEGVASVLRDLDAAAIDRLKLQALEAAKVENAEREMATLAALYRRLVAGADPWGAG
jgi:hypothetical protein